MVQSHFKPFMHFFCDFANQKLRLRIFLDKYQVSSGLPNFLAATSDAKVFSNECMVFDYPKEFDDPPVSDGLKVISNERMDFDDPKVYKDTSIFDGLVVKVIFMLIDVDEDEEPSMRMRNPQ